MALTITIIVPNNAAAATTTNMNAFQIQDRVTKLYKNYNKTGFTNVDGVYGNECPNGHDYHKSYDCSYCAVVNVIKTSKIKNEYTSGITTGNMPKHYGSGNALSLGDSCCGFVSYAGFYIFGNGMNRSCPVKKIGTYNFTSANKATIKSSARYGDMIRFNDIKGHSAIYLATTDKGVFVLDSNWYDYQNCVVRVHTVPWSNYSKITFTRGTNRLTAVPKVKNLILKKANNAVTISWNAVSGADKYQVYRATSKDGKYSLLFTTAKTTVKNTGLKSGKTYYYKVRAFNTFSGYSTTNKCMSNSLKSYSSFSDIKGIKY